MNREQKQKVLKKRYRQVKTRNRLKLVSSLPRLSVFRSNKHMYAQVIDDTSHTTVVGIAEKENGKGTKTERARELGREVAKLALTKKIKQVVFDKGQYAYHGRVKALAEGAREGGLAF